MDRKSAGLSAGIAATVLGAALYAGAAGALPTRDGSFSDWTTPASAEIGSHPMLNTSSNDGCPILSPDGLSLFMASNRPGSVGLDIWVARRDSTTEGWGNPEQLPSPVNSSHDDFCPTPVRGNRLFFVSRRDDPNGDIYETRLGRNGWDEPRRLGPNINSPDQEWSPSYFEDEQGRPVLYFSSTRSGRQEIYASVDGGPAERVTELSSGGSDAARPNVRRDGREIVFDSTRSPNQGGPDVWTATRASTSSPWSPPVHLPGVSSGAPDTRASLSWDGTILLVGSARQPGEGSADIYVSTRTRRTGK